MSGPSKRFLSVFSLVSRIPLRIVFEPDYSRSDFWLPLIGIPASLAALCGLFLASLFFTDPLLRVIGAFFVQYAGFNMFHLDGLLDTADAMTPLAERERRLEILKDSRIGAYAFFYGLFSVAAKIAALAALAPAGMGSASAIAAILAYPASGRAASALVPCLAPPARPGGLGALMRGFALRRCALGWLLALAPLAAWSVATGRESLGLASAGASLFGAVLAGPALARLYKRRVGGFTGDALGAAVEAGELACLLALAALLPRLGLVG